MRPLRVSLFNEVAMTKKQTLVLVDGSAVAFRMFFALLTAGMRTVDGRPTWAVYGFLRAILDVLEKRTPDMIAVCFDLKAPTFRHAQFDGYKANRAQMPDDLAAQWPLFKRGLELFQIPIYELSGFEADDIIGTVAKQAGARDMDVLILTGDQDAFQLLDGYIQVLMPGREGLVTYGRQEVFDKLGVWPDQVADYKGLCGDTSDNIPGVRGIGPKTASQLLSQFGTIEGVYDNLDSIKSASIKQKLTDGKESAVTSKSLATIRLDVPLEFDFEHCRPRMPDVASVASFLREMEFNTILKRLPKVLAPFNAGVEPQLDEALMQPATRQAKAKVAVGVAAAASPGPAEDFAPAQLSLFSGSIVAPHKVEPQLIRTEDALRALVEDLSRQSVIAIDIETTSMSSLECEVVGYAFAWGPGLKKTENGYLEIDGSEAPVQTAYVPVRHFDEAQLNPAVAAGVLKPLLENPAVGKIAQNAKFALNVLSQEGIVLAPVVFDPMVASYISNTEEGHGLKDQAGRLLGYTMVEVGDIASGKKKHTSMAAIPAEKAALRAGDHAQVSLELSRFYCPRLDDQQKFLLWNMDLPLSAVLAKMEQNGIALDEFYLAQFAAELAAELERLEAEIHQLAGHSFNINSTQQLQKVLFEELKLTAKGKTKSGFSTDASVLEAIAKEHPIVAKILEYRHDSKLRSTYVEALPKLISRKDGRLHGEFNQTGTSTGRLSSVNPNLQNIPIRTELGRRIRRAFIPGNPDSVLLAADYSQIELRLLAHMCEDELLIDAFQKNQDIHARTAMEIFEVPIENVTADMRRVGKTLNFALIYQQGAYSTAQNLGISTREAQGFIDKYFSRYPKVRNFLTGSIEEARARGYATTLWGRRRYFRHLNDRNDVLRRAEERAACNAPIQGSAADLMKLAMIRLDNEIVARKLNAKLILQVHDELVLEVPRDEIDATRETVVAAMGYDQQLKVPLQVDVGVGPNWMECK